MKRFAFLPLLTLALIVALVLPAHAAPPTTEAYTVVEFMGSGYIPDGAQATLKRHSDKVHVKIDTNNLEAGDVYTVWAIVFNNPGECAVPLACSGSDFSNAAVGGSVFWATGKVIDSEGEAVFNAMIHEGTPAGAVNFGPGLTNTAGAELHFVIRSHGQPIPGMVDEQKSTLLGGCNVNVCGDHQAAIPAP